MATTGPLLQSQQCKVAVGNLFSLQAGVTPFRSEAGRTRMTGARTQFLLLLFPAVAQESTAAEAPSPPTMPLKTWPMSAGQIK